MNGSPNKLMDINKNGGFSFIDNTIGKTFTGNTCVPYSKWFDFEGERR